MEFTFDLLARRRRPPLAGRAISALSRAALALAVLFFAHRLVATAAGLAAIHREARGPAAAPPPGRAEVEAFARRVEAASVRMSRLDLSYSRLLDSLEVSLPQGVAVRRIELSAGGPDGARGAITAQGANLESGAKAAAALAALEGFRDVTLRHVSREGGKVLFRLEFRHERP